LKKNRRDEKGEDLYAHENEIRETFSGFLSHSWLAVSYNMDLDISTSFSQWGLYSIYFLLLTFLIFLKSFPFAK